MRVAAYVRVSTGLQAEEGLGLAIQGKGIRAWAKASGHRITQTFSDEGISGATEAVDRPGLAGALALIDAGKAEGLVVYRLDRLARALTIQEATLGLVWQAGGTVFTVDGGEVLQDDPDDPMRTALRQMVGVFSELERAMIAARLRAGRRLKAEQGGYAGGQPPFGYRAEGGELVPHDTEQKAVALMRRLRSKGRSLREIASALEASGYTPRHRGAWHPKTVREVLIRTEGRARYDATVAEIQRAERSLNRLGLEVREGVAS